jgi:hypothetical protein
MNVMSMVLVSKIVEGLECGARRTEISMEKTLNRKAHDVPRMTRTSIVGDPCLRDLYPET